MRLRAILLSAAVLALATLPEPGWAQQPVHRKQPYSRRPSPSLTYLNLFRNRAALGGSRSAAFNYYTLVRPELELRRRAEYQAGQIQTLGNELQSFEQNPNAAGQAPLRATGHQSGFMNFSHFYPGMR